MEPMQAAALFTALSERRGPDARSARTRRAQASHPRRRPLVARLRIRRHPPE